LAPFPHTKNPLALAHPPQKSPVRSFVRVSFSFLKLFLILGRVPQTGVNFPFVLGASCNPPLAPQDKTKKKNPPKNTKKRTSFWDLFHWSVFRAPTRNTTKNQHKAQCLPLSRAFRPFLFFLRDPWGLGLDLISRKPNNIGDRLGAFGRPPLVAFFPSFLLFEKTKLWVSAAPGVWFSTQPQGGFCGSYLESPPLPFFFLGPGYKRFVVDSFFSPPNWVLGEPGIFSNKSFVF